jgi:hypothetical protein
MCEQLNQILQSSITTFVTSIFSEILEKFVDFRE